MKCLSLALVGALTAGLPGAARALPVDSVLTLVVLDGPDASDGTTVGAFSFKLDEDMGADCRYSATWDGSFDGYLMAGCSLDESKTFVHTECAGNSQAAFATMVAKVPRSTCTGLDGFGQRRDIFMLVAAEMSDLGGLLGLIQWTAADAFVYAFEAHPYP